MTIQDRASSTCLKADFTSLRCPSLLLDIFSWLLSQPNPSSPLLNFNVTLDSPLMHTPLAGGLDAFFLRADTENWSLPPNPSSASAARNAESGAAAEDDQVSPSLFPSLTKVAHSSTVLSQLSTSVGFLHPSLFLFRLVPSGRGVSTLSPLPSLTVIELSPAILVPSASMWIVDSRTYRDAPMSVLGDYLFPVKGDDFELPGYSLNVLGWGMMYNHCSKGSDNLKWEIVRDEEGPKVGKINPFTALSVRFYTIKEVPANTELCWDYGEAYWGEGTGRRAKDVVGN